MPPVLELLIRPPGYVPGGRDVKRALDRGAYRAKSGRVVWTDTSPVSLFSVPANTLILNTIAHIVTAWAGTTPTNTVGDVGSAARFLATTDITATSIEFYTKASPGPKVWEYTADSTITLTIGGTSLTNGVTQVWVFYVPNSNREIP